MTTSLEETLKKEGCSEAKIKELVAMFGSLEDGHMGPNIYPAEAIVIDTNEGGQAIDSDVLSASELKKLKNAIKKDNLEAAREILRDYMEGSKLFSAEIKKGYMGNLSAPGYMDRTEPSLYDTVAETIEHLHEMFGDES